MESRLAGLDTQSVYRGLGAGEPVLQSGNAGDFSLTIIRERLNINYVKNHIGIVNVQICRNINFLFCIINVWVCHLSTGCQGL